MPHSPKAILEAIPLEKIDPNPYASRKGEIEVSELSLSLAKIGQLAPIRVRPSPEKADRYQIIFGHRRVLGAHTLGWKVIEAQITVATDEEMIVFALTENLERDNYTDFEKSLLMKELHELFGKSLDEIATLLGKSKSYVSQHLTMTSLFDSPLIDAAEATSLLQKLTERQARVLSRVSDPIERVRLAKVTLKEELSMTEMARLVSQPKEISPEDDQVTDWKDLNASSEEQLSEIIRETLEGISNRDIRPFMAHRMPKLFSLFDDFPPPDLIEYSDAADHHTTIIKQAQKIDTTCDKMRIYVFGNFAFATFIAVYKIFQGGKCFTLRSRVTYNFMKKDHEWFIIHEHWSPFKNSSLYNLERLQKH